MALEIRTAELRDTGKLLEMAHAMHEESPRYRMRAFCEAKARGLIEHLITTGGGFVAVLNGEIVGMVGGILFEYFFGQDKMCSDLVVYVVPEWRGSSIFVRLIKAFEAWAWGNGACEIVLGVSTGVGMDATVCVYERLGYKIAATSLIKPKAYDV